MAGASCSCALPHFNLSSNLTCFPVSNPGLSLFSTTNFFPNYSFCHLLVWESTRWRNEPTSQSLIHLCCWESDAWCIGISATPADLKVILWCILEYFSNFSHFRYVSMLAIAALVLGRGWEISNWWQWNNIGDMYFSESVNHISLSLNI